MPSSDYTSAVGGGLKLKGAKGAGIEKKKKKKKPKPESDTNAKDDPDQHNASAVQKALADEEQVMSEDKELQIAGEGLKENESKDFGKTEAQRRHEERRKKRLDERLKREGVKTHKERVEELNKYLSNLSEHHDMPRIGPG